MKLNLCLEKPIFAHQVTAQRTRKGLALVIVLSELERSLYVVDLLIGKLKQFVSSRPLIGTFLASVSSPPKREVENRV